MVTQTMHVRSFQLSDYRELLELLQTVLSEACYEDTLSALSRQLSWDSDLVLVAEIDGAIAGVIIGTIDKNRAYYYRIAVHADHRNRGIGKTLINALKQRFEQRNVDRILIAADEHNEPILSLYESMGYAAQDFFRSFQKLSIVAG